MIKNIIIGVLGVLFTISLIGAIYYEIQFQKSEAKINAFHEMLESPRFKMVCESYMLGEIEYLKRKRISDKLNGR